jgi:hypothetical protein
MSFYWQLFLSGLSKQAYHSQANHVLVIYKLFHRQTGGQMGDKPNLSESLSDDYSLEA